MTRVCLVGEEEINLRYELLSRETAREALMAYELHEPFENSVAVDTVSLGAAVALLNDLQWYLIRFVDESLVFEPSVSETEWLSRGVAAAIRDGEIEPDESGRFLKIYGLASDNADGDESGAGGVDTDESDTRSADGDESGAGRTDGDESDTGGADGEESDAGGPTTHSPLKLVEPMFVARTGEALPPYDLRDVDETLRVRVTESEFEQ